MALLNGPKVKYFDAAGRPLAGGLLYTYEARSSTPKYAYQDASLETYHTNPIELDAQGEALVYLAGSYKLTLKDHAGVIQPGWPIDNVVGVGIDTYGIARAKDYGTLNAAIEAIGDDNITLIVDDTVAMDDYLEVSKNISLSIIGGGKIANGSYASVIYGPFKADRQQVFTGTGTVDFRPGSVEAIFPEWWGALADDDGAGNGTECTAAFQSAVDQSIPVVFGEGKYRLDGDVVLSGSPQLRGSGAYSTYIEYYGSGKAFSFESSSSAIFGLNVRDLTIRNRGTGTMGVSCKRANWIDLENVAVVGSNSSHPWLIAGIKVDGDNGGGSGSYNNSLRNVDLDFAAIGLWMQGGSATETKMYGGRLRLCPVGIKLVDANMQIYGVNFSALSTTYAGPTYDGTGVRLESDSIISSFGSRFESMDTAYDNKVTNNIQSICDIISSTNVNHSFYDKDLGADNLSYVISLPRIFNLGLSGSSHLGPNAVTNGSSPYLSIFNTAYDEIRVKSVNSATGTFNLYNQTQSKNLLTVDRNGTKTWLGDSGRAIQFRSTIPTSGTYAQGDMVFKINSTVDANGFVQLGWYRLTDGSAHVLGTDWTGMYVRSASNTSGTGAPSANAAFIGQVYTDTSALDSYVAVQIGTGATDWKKTTP